MILSATLILALADATATPTPSRPLRLAGAASPRSIWLPLAAVLEAALARVVVAPLLAHALVLSLAR